MSDGCAADRPPLPSGERGPARGEVIGRPSLLSARGEAVPHPGSLPKGERGPEYLSIVATARNDNHGGDLLRRMQLFIDGLAEQCERFGLDAELVLVEWNPPPPEEAARLEEVLQWPAGGSRLRCRIVGVPAEVHRRFRYSDRLPLFQMIAKNVGIRRARGRFVLATNVDLLFSDELMAFLAKRELREDAFYRCDRHDVEPPPEGLTADALAWCRGHVIRRNGYDGIHDARTGALHRVHWERTWRVRLLERLQDWGIVPTVTRPRVHVNACGDFTLMARGAWERLRGYPELEVFSMHLDSVLLYQAWAAGLREVALAEPMVAYHVEHAVGSGWSVEGEAKLNERLAERGIEQLPVERLNAWAVKMRREGKPMVLSGEGWGLAGEELAEVSASAGERSGRPISCAKPQAA